MASESWAKLHSTACACEKTIQGTTHQATGIQTPGIDTGLLQFVKRIEPKLDSPKRGTEFRSGPQEDFLPS